MNLLKLIPAILSFLLLGAHFSRADVSPLMFICIAFPLLFFVKKPWVARLSQLLLVLGALEWIRAIYIYAIERQAIGESWTRLAMILGIVALFTGFSALVFRFGSLRKRYKLRST